MINSNYWLLQYSNHPNHRHLDERIYGIFQSAHMANMYSVAKAEYPSSHFWIYRGQVFVTNTVGFQYALSLSNVTGLFYWFDVLLASWDPTKFECWMSVASSVNVYGSNQLFYMHRGINTGPLLTNISALSVATPYRDMNKDRNVANANPANTYNMVVLLVIQK